MKARTQRRFSILFAVAGFFFVFVGAVSVSFATEYKWNYGTAGTANSSDSTA